MTRFRPVRPIALALMTTATALATPHEPPARICVPLEEGRLDLRTFFSALYDAMHVAPPPSLEAIDLCVDAEGLEALRPILDRHVAIEDAMRSFRDLLHKDKAAVTDASRRFRTTLSDWLREHEDAWQSTAEASSPIDASRFGPIIAGPDGAWLAPADWRAVVGEAPAHVVMLIHGLDEPGAIWNDLRVRLRAAGHVVVLERYPNDGPIAVSADQLARDLRSLRAAGVERVSIVAHSMGGLVTRDVLTRPAHYAGDGRGSATLPAVDHVVMCGTPNAGSAIVRLRAVSEIREQLARIANGDGFGGHDDGGGEAAVDLMPDSDFLRRLNARAAPMHTKMTIVAGRLSPIEPEDLDGLRDAIADAAASTNAPPWMRTWIDEREGDVRAFVESTGSRLGDGCVSLESARLPGVDDVVIVTADHVGMLRGEDAPALDIVMDRLSEAQTAD